MSKFAITCFLLTILTLGRAQDSSKVLCHEIGFNAGSLLQQIKIFTITPGQLPYDLFYNIYYKDKYGLRLGLGLLTESTLTEIEGQNTPRSTSTKKNNIRAGISANFLTNRRLAINAFIDGFTFNNSSKTSNTFTAQVFPNPVITRTVSSTDQITGGGIQVGTGVKIMLLKNLWLYTELPIIYSTEYHLIEDSIQETGIPDVKTKKLTTVTGTKIAVPVTVYIVLRF